MTRGAGASVDRIDVGDLRGIIVDADELRKGTELFDGGGLAHLSRYEGKLFGEAKGSTAVYRVSLAFGEGAMNVRARCTCPAAWSRPFCKHAAALLVAWSRAPEAFAVSETAPPGAPGASAAGPRT